MNTLKNVTALATILACSETTIYRNVRAGKIPHKRVGTLIRFTDQDIESYMESAKSGKVEDKNEA